MIAHIRAYDGKEQSVSEHCKGTELLCAEYASGIGAACIAKTAGRLHDIGKMTRVFENYIRNETNYRRGEIDHSFAGAKMLCDIASDIADADKRDVIYLIARIILSHHGIHDWLDDNENDYLLQRIQKEDGYAEIQKHINDVLPEETLSMYLEQAAEEYRTISAIIKRIAKNLVDKKKQKYAYAFYMGMLERFLQSCLIDADRTDTADFMSEEHTEIRCDIGQLWEEMFARIEAKSAAFAKRTDSVSKQRCSISDRCAEFAEHPIGVCRLIVPTGGGKTLSSLRFAIRHCRKFRKKKIIYTAPFMSILEQNSEEIRAITGEEYFTEHHSDYYAELDSEEELHEYELRTEKWDSPVIATTMVQLLNTLFSAKTSSVRRMHRLANAVLIVDEVQSIPLKCVNLFNLAINFLSCICGTTVVLCSATQPVMEETEYPIILDTMQSMTGEFEKDFTVLHRTDLISLVTPYGMTYEEAADFAAEKYEERGNLLFIVNTKAAARALYDLIREKCPDTSVIHLSTNLCPQHRREKIQLMKELLEKKEPVICITTQLIEAGVDISFGCVIRSLAGVDNAAQAAGRCNRNGESAVPCPVYLVKLKEEKIGKLEGMRVSQHVTEQILSVVPPKGYLSYDTQSMYFRKVFQQAERDGLLSYPVQAFGLDTNLLELLSLNKDHFKLATLSGLPSFRRFSVQAFRTAGRLFEVIDTKTQDIVVPFNEEAKGLMEDLDADLSPSQVSRLLKKAQKYTVSVYDGQNRKLQENGAVRILKAGIIGLDDRFYDTEYGILTEGAEQEVLMI